MEQQVANRANSEANRVEPVMLPDVATEPHPTAHPSLPAEAGAGNGELQDALPEITAAARKVGGFKRLSEIASQLDRAGIGQ